MRFAYIFPEWTRHQPPAPQHLAITVSMPMRVVIHLYYGPGSLAYLLWACVAVVLYLYGRTLMPLIAAHLWWNVGVGLEMVGFITSSQLNIVSSLGFDGEFSTWNWCARTRATQPVASF
ncbi:CPBP family intramembrane metalloprotease [Brevibacterium permense]|uniref:CPBP family glutamic-type intramembrane protease n=1 Tax=Brevibacterium permense TaxID=234834 RepID=UPI0034E2D85E|nr:CPBP family intramembrane metalloprotease [Brevibacterium permense]